MAVPTTVDQLLELVRKSELVASQRLDDYLAALSGSKPNRHDPRRLAARLVRDGLLTTFQAEQFLQGRWKGFTLGKYRILEKLGAGGMGAVFLCEHSHMRHRVAIKVLPEEKARDKAALGRFYREARAAAGLDHPNIVRAFDIDQDGGRHFLVMEYVDGSSLQELVSRRGPLEVVRAVHYLRQATFGLQRAYEAGLVHRDVKPGNLLVDRTGVVKVADLGLARFFHDDQDALTREHDDGAILGSADYFAPEQAINSHEVDIRGDIYALGCTFYFLLTGRPPFHEATVTQKLLWHQMKTPRPVRELRPEVPAELAAVLDRMLAKKPEARFQTPAELAAALEPWTTTPIEPLPDADFRSLSPAAQGSGSSDTRTGPGSSRTKLSYPGIPEKPREVGSEAPFAWDKLDNSAISYGPSPPSSAASGTRRGESSKRLDRVPPQRKYVLTGGAVLLTLAFGLVLWLMLGGSRQPANSGKTEARADQQAAKPSLSIPQPRGNVRLIRAKNGRVEGFLRISDALTNAGTGDRILVEAEAHAEFLLLAGDGQLGRDVTIEGRGPSGLPVHWLPESDHAKEQPLLALRNVSGLRLTGFRFDGQNRVNDLVVLADRCPGLTLEGVQFHGFLSSAVKFRACEGEPFRPVALQGITTASEKEAETLLHFETPGGKPNQHVEVRESRLAGRCKAAVRVAGPLTHAVFRGNRFFQGGDGFHFLKANPAPQLHLSVAANTFAKFANAFHWEAVPPGSGGNQVLLHDNLFVKTRRLATTDGVPTQPVKTAAQWVWFEEPGATKEAVPTEARYFRKSFEVSSGAITRATLDIACDDSFTVWLNGMEVGRSPFQHFTKQVYSFELFGLLKAGKNVLAVEGKNLWDLATGKPTGARLLAQLSYTVQGQPPVVVMSDASWKAGKAAPPGWQQATFNEAGWTPVRVLGTYSGSSDGGQLQLTWESASRQPATQNWLRVFSALGNFRDGSGSEGFPALEARFGNFSLPLDPAKDSEFLRYDPTSPLAAAGTARGPVGVPPPIAVSSPARIVRRGTDGKELSCRSVREALLQARPGERIVVHGEWLEEPLTLWDKDGFRGPVTLEGISPTGGPVRWRTPDDLPSGRPLVRLADLAGLTVRGFLFDGRDRVEDLIHLVGLCPGTAFEEVQLRGFRRTALLLRDCSGSKDKPVALRRLRVTASSASVHALLLEAAPGQANRFVQIHDARLEGPYESAVVLSAPVTELEIRRTRFHRALTGILLRKGEPRRQLHLNLDSNTFCDVQRIVHLEAMLGPEPTNQILLRNNLMVRASRLVHADGFEFEPKTPASWIWSAESGDMTKSVPGGVRYFRKKFELPRDKVASAVLNLLCDDAFTVWVNGQEVGKGQFATGRRVVPAFDVAKHLRPGVNLLAIEGRNHQGLAGLLTHLTIRTTADGKTFKDHQIISDSSWQVLKEIRPDWQKPECADADWPAARVVTSYAKSLPTWQFFLWQSQLDRQKGKVLWPLVHPHSAGNVSPRGAGVGSGYTFLEVSGAGTSTSLGIDPDQDGTYLRYRRENPLARAGVNQGPVGVPPE